MASDKAEEYIPYYQKSEEAVMQVVSEPDVRDTGTYYVCKPLSFGETEAALTCNLRLYIKGDTGSFVYGDVLKSVITVTEPDVARNPGNFDYKQYLLSLNIGATATVSSLDAVEWLRHEAGNIIVALSIQCRTAMLQAVRNCMPDTNSYLTEAIFLGDKSYLGEEVTDIFSAAGISHFMAVSGAHAAFFIMPFSLLMQKMGIKKQRRYIAEILLLLCYVAVAGFGIPIIRAGIMMSLKRLAFLVKRDYDQLVALLLALSILMAYNPYVIYSISMQLSFGAVLSMHWIQPVFKKWITSFRVTQYVAPKIVDSVCLCLSVQLGTLPVLVNQFQMPSVFVVLANLLCAPLVELLMLCGILITVLGLLKVTFLGTLVGYAAYFLGDVVVEIAGYVAKLSELQSWGIIYFHTWQLLLYYVLLAGVIWIRSKGWKHCAAAGLCIFLFVCSMTWPTKTLQMTCIDVGQGESIYIRTPSGNHYLIDCGSSSVGQVAEYRILPYLKTQKVTALDGIFLSHYDADHISGIQAILEIYEVAVLFLPDAMSGSADGADLVGLAEQYGTEIRYWQQGDGLTDATVQFTCLYPYSGLKKEDANAMSMVLKVKYGAFEALFTGDLPMESEANISEKAGTCDVLKVGHHGSASSTGVALLQTVQPQIALISCGVNNRYGHPDEDVLERLEAADCQIFITAECGAVTVKTNGENIRVTNFL